MDWLLLRRVLLSTFGLTLCALGQVSIVPALVNLGAPVGSTQQVTQTVFLTTSGAAGQNLAFDISIRYQTPTAGWLSVSPLTGTTPGTLVLVADPSNLPQGTYSAQVLATVGPLRIGAWTNVSFTIAPSGGNSGLSVSPSSLSFSGQVVTSPQTLNVSNRPGVTGPVSFSAFASSSGWLAITSASRTTPGTLTVEAYPAGLSAGIHTGTITILTGDAAKTTVVPVALVVTSSGSDRIELSTSQKALIFNYQLGASSNPTQTVNVPSDSTTYINYNLTTSSLWLGVSCGSWIPPAATASCFAPGLFYVTVDPTGLPADTYRGRITLASGSQGPVDLPVTLNVAATPVLNANPSFLFLDAGSSLLSTNLAVTGSSTLSFTATVAGGTPWLSVTPRAGTAGFSPTDLTVIGNVTGLAPGTYDSSILIAGPGGTPSINVPVRLKNGEPEVPTAMQVAPKELTFSAIAGDPPPSAFLSVFSPSTAAERFSAAAISEGGWLSVEPLTGTTPAWPKASASTAIAPGVYTGSIVITSLVTGDQETIDVKYTLTSRLLTVTPAALDFAPQSAGGTVPSKELQVTANAPSSFRIVKQPDWIKVQPVTGLNTPAKLTVSANPANLAPGRYDGTINFSGPSDASVAVSLTIPAPPPPTVSPSSISFTYQLGSPAPQAQTVRVESPNGVRSFTVAVSTDSGVNWLTATPREGSTPADVALGVNVAQLIPGTQMGSVAITIADSPPKTLTVPVTLTVTGVGIQIREVLNTATMAPTAIAPGEMLTITGIGLGPAVPVVARASAAGAFGTQLAGIQVLFDGIPAPLLAVASEQINAIAPYALDARTSTRVQVQSDTSYSLPIDVKAVAAAPGIFTASNSGSGQASALNADATRNSVVNPADRGSVIVLYLTGEGQTDPPGQDGRVIMADLRTPLLPVTALIGGKTAEVLYAGSGPTLVSGMCQVNVRIPEGLQPGTQPVEVQVGGIASQRRVTIEVR